MSNNNCEKIYFITVIILIMTIFFLSRNILEGFYDTDMLEFTRLDDSLIRRYKIGSSYNLYDSDVFNLFRNDDVIRIKIPFNYVAKIIYKYKDDNKGFAKTIELVEGNYDIKKTIGNKIIDQIIIKNLSSYNNYFSDYPVYRPYYNPYYRPYYRHHYRPYNNYPRQQLF